MLTGVYQSGAILAIFIIFYALDSWLLSRFDRLREKGSSRSWSYTFFAVLVAVLNIIQPVLWPGVGLQTAALWGLLVQSLGVLLVLGGLGLHGWARTNLGQFYGEREELQAKQYLINTGPYAHMRHPLYTSYFLLATGVLLINPALPTLLTALYAYYDFSTAAIREEKMMSGKLAGYDDYLARTPRFIPRLFGTSRTK